MNKLIVMSLLGGLLAGCVTMTKPSVEEQRLKVKEMRYQTVQDVAKFQPDIRDRINKAPGYAVFSNANVNLIFASFAGGYGVVRNNKTGRDTYMKMAEAGVGLGIGVKDFRAIFVFRNQEALNAFVEKGWQVGAGADATAKASDKGDGASAEISASDIEIFQITEAGLALQATVKGTRYWKDDELN